MQLVDVPYVAGRIARRMIPKSLASRHRGTEHDDLLRLIKVHEEQLAAVTRMDLDVRGETVLSLEADGHAPAAAAFLGAGAERVVFLGEGEAEVDRQLLGRRLGDLLGAFGYSERQWQEVTAPDRRKDPQVISFGGGKIEFRSGELGNMDLPNDSAGLIVSESVLQCLPNPEAVVAEMARVLEPGGGMYHKIDLRDESSQFPLQFLCYSDYVWSRLLTSQQPRKAYLNRLRLPEWVDLFEAYELEVETQVLTRDLELIRRLRPHLDDHFLQFSNDELSPLVVNLYCYKV